MSTFESLAFYRGVSDKYPADRPYIFTPRCDRRPKNSPLRFHEIADQWFESRFGIAYRSRGLFLTSGLLSATTYAASPDHVMRIVPLTIHSYCWSPSVSDLLFEANRLANSPIEEIESFLDSAQYCEGDLKDAHDTGYEVMLFCEQYIAIPVGLLDGVQSSNRRSIILPT